MGKQGAQPPHAALDLVENQQDVLFVAQLAQALEELLLPLDDAALPLEDLGEDGTGAVGDQRLHTLQVVKLRLPGAGNLGHENALIGRVIGGAQGTHGAAVEGMTHGDDFIFPGCVDGFVAGSRIFLGHLQGPFVPLRPAVAEEDLAEFGCFDDLLRRLNGRHVVVIVAELGPLVQLGLQRLGEGLMAVAQRGHRNPCHKVQVLLPFGIIKVGTLSMV